MSKVVNVAVRTATAVRKGVLWLGVALLVLLGLLGPRVFPLAHVALWYVTGGPPLDFDAPHDGQVVAHIDVLGAWGWTVPPDIARIRISKLSSGTTVWDVKPTTDESECWNACWNLTLKAGTNPASFSAGHQRFNASVPQDASFVLARGTAYLFEVWDRKGRVERDRFTL
jgi:hypothetical protein